MCDGDDKKKEVFRKILLSEIKSDVKIIIFLSTESVREKSQSIETHV